MELRIASLSKHNSIMKLSMTILSNAKLSILYAVILIVICFRVKRKNYYADLHSSEFCVH